MVREVKEVSESDFRQRVEDSYSKDEILFFEDEVVTLKEGPIKLPRRKTLTIIGGTIIGDCHSVFLMNDDSPPTQTPTLGTSTKFSILICDQGCSTLNHLFYSVVPRSRIKEIRLRGTTL